ncbi:FBP domain-containing protein [Agromyces seonyuensis]|uniref:FBP domain-containing protein n=1 Tax=Agromyces seonyuensis TaxID=2662446 RepID=A0A6I4NY45_9MICO|nr:FBP domain-containing protein [Agromyces seonyuensis]MWB99178.1 FBP domain-containing protein [Agromyces seonyuensis]
MLPLTEAQIRASFVNASKRERDQLVLPADFGDLDWDRRDFLGWRDRKQPQVGYVVVELDGALVGVLLRQTEARSRTRPQCSWCEDVHLPNDVVFYGAKRAGAAGRKGDTIGTLVCADFECSANARKRPPTAYIGFDVEAARLRRIEALAEHVRAFVADVVGAE